jgi:ParB family chromosome partitioning protein
LTVTSQFRRISCSPLEVQDLHTSWAAVSDGPFFYLSLNSDVARLARGGIGLSLVRGGRKKNGKEEKGEEETGRRSVLPPTLTLNRRLPHPGNSSFAGPIAPLVLRRRDARPQLRRSGRPAVRKMSSEKRRHEQEWQRAAPYPVKEKPMYLVTLDPRALKDNPDKTRQSKSSPQGDALLLATIKAVGIIQPPVVEPEKDGGNGYIIDAGHRRVRQAIAAGLEEIQVLVDEAANDNGAMRSMVENTAREPLNPVDQWRGIERLVALGWTEEAIALALTLQVRQVRKLRLLANVLPAMLDQMALGDMPSEQQLRTIASASVEEQKQVWKANKPKKGERASWHQISSALAKKRMYAKDASFGDDLAAAYGVEWVEDLFAPADEDTRYTTNVEGFLGAQHEWMTANLPKRGAIVEVNSWGQPELPRKAERVYSKPQKSDHAGIYLDRDGKVQTVYYRLPEVKKPKGAGGATTGGVGEAEDDTIIGAKPRPDVTQKGLDMVGDFRTDALHEALGRAPIEDDTLLALLVLAFAGTNVRVDSGAGDTVYGQKRFARHVVRLIDENGKLSFDLDTLRVVARSTLVEVLSCRRGMSNSGVISRIAGDAIGADGYLPNMGSEDFLLCLSRQALEASCKDASVLPRQKVRETRAALVDHYQDGHFVHPSALFAPEAGDVADLIKRGEVIDADDDGPGSDEEEIAASEDVEAGTEAAHSDPSEAGDGESGEDPADTDGGSDTPATDEDDSAYGIAAE